MMAKYKLVLLLLLVAIASVLYLQKTVTTVTPATELVCVEDYYQYRGRSFRFMLCKNEVQFYYFDAGTLSVDDRNEVINRIKAEHPEVFSVNSK